MGTTTKMAIPYPEATGLVKDGWEDMKDIADQVDAKSGLVLLNRTSFSGVATQSINNVFNTNFKNYRIIINYTGNADNTLALYLRASGTDNSSNNCFNVGYYHTTGSSAINATTINTVAYFWIGETRSNPATSIVDLFSPFETAATGHATRATYGYGSTPIGGETVNGGNNVTTSYDGFTIDAIGASTLTGTVYTYGCN